jgi:hypothetical protein
VDVGVGVPAIGTGGCFTGRWGPDAVPLRSVISVVRRAM